MLVVVMHRQSLLLQPAFVKLRSWTNPSASDADHQPYEPSGAHTNDDPLTIEIDNHPSPDELGACCQATGSLVCCGMVLVACSEILGR